MSLNRFFIIFCGILAAVSNTARAEFLTIYGGPASSGVSLQGSPGLTSSGVAFETVLTDLGYRAFRWDTTGAPVELSGLGGDTAVKAISASGVAVGYSEVISGATTLGLQASSVWYSPRMGWLQLGQMEMVGSPTVEQN
jgi:hypothetical protein